MNQTAQKHRRMPPAKKTPMMVINEVSKLFRDTLRESDDPNIQGSYRSLLFHLAHEDGRTQLELSKLTHLKPPTISITIRKMEDDGYVTRVIDENDMRQVRVYLTEKGRNHDMMIQERINAIEQKVMMNITPEETEIVMHILERMRENLMEGMVREEPNEK